MVHRALAFLIVSCLACSSGAHSAVRDASSDAAGLSTGVDASPKRDSGPSPAADSGRADLDSGAPAADGGDASAIPLHIVVFSKTAGYRHESIGPATSALSQIATKHGAAFETTEDAAQLVTKLTAASVVVFLMTTGDVLDNAQQAAFERYMRAGGGFVGVHSSADTEYDWPFYRDLNGAWFAGHPEVQPAKLVVDAKEHPLVSFLPAEWTRSDEWYNFKDNPRTRGVTVLLRLDESSYNGGTQGADHPIAWMHKVGEGRAFYTGLGHTVESWQEAQVLQHVELGLLWAAGK